MSEFDMSDLFMFSMNSFHQDVNFLAENSDNVSENYYQTQMMVTSIDESPKQTSQTQPKLICGVCGAPAIGYNFDQITCESCKAFFRRNALRDLSSLKCRFSGSCTINVNTRRRCAYCRLKKCFDIKMRKDWIRTEEEKQYRQLMKIAKEQKRVDKIIRDERLFIQSKRCSISKVTEDEFSSNSFDTM